MTIFNKFKNIFKNSSENQDYQKGLAKTRDNFVGRLDKLSKKHQNIDRAYFDDLEEILISADIGVETVLKLIDRLEKRIKKEKILVVKDLKEIIVDELFLLYVDDDNLTDKMNLNNELNVWLFVGVNGSGKTTSIAKMAHYLKSQNYKVLLVAGDTFRAGAVEQLEKWGKHLDLSVVSSVNSDPASVIYEGIEKAKNENYDVVLIDTAGRLQQKKNLMDELAKINRVISKLIPNAPHETLLVIDATTGQNGISQAKSFKEITNITGIILTKLDGTAKGGIVIAIKDVAKIPVKFVGFGEKITDLKIFDIEKYLYSLFKEWDNE